MNAHEINSLVDVMGIMGVQGCFLVSHATDQFPFRDIIFGLKSKSSLSTYFIYFPPYVECLSSFYKLSFAEFS